MEIIKTGSTYELLDGTYIIRFFQRHGAGNIIENSKHAIENIFEYPPQKTRKSVSLPYSYYNSSWNNDGIFFCVTDEKEEWWLFDKQSKFIGLFASYEQIEKYLEIFRVNQLEKKQKDYRVIQPNQYSGEIAEIIKAKAEKEALHELTLKIRRELEEEYNSDE